MENIDISHLGYAHRVVATKDNTTVVGGKGDKKEIDDRVAQLRAQLKKTDSEFDKEKLQERLGKLAGGVAVIKVGAPTESAQKELKQRVEDAVAATRAAMEEGIVPGGGIALFNVNIDLLSKEHGSEIKGAAAKILSRALESPLIAIIANSGESPNKIIQELKSEKEKNKIWLGFNAVTNRVEDLKEAGIIDPLKVVKTAFLNAVSVAANYLTIGAAVTEIPKKEEKGGGMPPGMGEY